LSESILLGKEEVPNLDSTASLNFSINDLNCIYDIITASIFNIFLALTPDS